MEASINTEALNKGNTKMSKEQKIHPNEKLASCLIDFNKIIEEEHQKMIDRINNKNTERKHQSKKTNKE